MAEGDDEESPRAIMLEMSHILQEKAKKFSGSSHMEDVLARANKIQKKMKHGPRITSERDDVVLISVCEMVEKKSGSGFFTRSSVPFVEMEARRSDSYANVVKKAIKKINVRSGFNGYFALFKLNGSMILNEPITLRSKAKPWTLGSYLGLIKKAPSNVKLGVGFLSEKQHSGGGHSSDDEHQDSGCEESCGNGKTICVKYVKARKLVDRKQIWNGMGHAGRCVGTYQPEVAGYHLVSVCQDGCVFMYPNPSAGYGVVTSSGNKDAVAIEWQSPSHVVVKNWKTSIALYCIPSIHPDCDYSWTMSESSRRFHSTPVVYVRDAGVYRCVVSYGSNKLEGDIITVSVEVDSDCELESGSSSPLRRTSMQKRAPMIEPETDSEGAPSVSAHTVVSASYSSSAITGPPAGFVHASSTKIKPPAVSARTSISTSSLAAVCQTKTPPAVSRPNPSAVSHHAPTAVSRPNPPAVSHHTPTAITGTTPAVSSSSDLPGATAYSSSTLPIVASSCSHASIIEQPPDDSDRGSYTHVQEIVYFSTMEFTRKDIIRATSNFSEVLGAGGFGKVYKGFMSGTKVAVKVLTEVAAFSSADVPSPFTAQGQLETEIKALTKCRHRNLLHLMGYCLTPPTLLYEFMEEGSLADKLFHNSNSHVLSWNQRSKILKDVIRGLAWLHGATPPLVHGDVKASNILIDKFMTAKVGDFGFTKELPNSTAGHTMVTAAAVAKSLGYCPPEHDTCHVSPKSDVYSYGIVTLETLSRKMAFDKTREDRLLAEHFEEARRQGLEGYKLIVDSGAGLIPHYLLLLYQRVIEGSLRKHSKRAASDQVMKWWDETNF